MDVVQECRLIKQISQDIFDSAGLRGSGHCDSSDCLLCQGQRTFCSKAVTDGVCSWLGKRLSGVNEPAAADAASRLSDESSAADADHVQLQQQDGEQEQQQQQQRSKRPRQDLDAPGTHLKPAKQPCRQAAASSTQGGGCAAQHHTAHHCSSWAPLGSTPWHWREEFAGRELPAPSKFVEVASLQQQPSGAAGAAPSGRRDMICGLEFSVDGGLLAAAGVNKQVALYPVAALHQPRSHAAAAAAAAGDVDGSCDDHPQQHQQHADAAVAPCLPPVALVRLPGKVSSIAWSPDMEGVLSIGDYDGTLTQVHVASGHYLCEIDAHAGRRIWSIAHSRLRPHLAATASNDHTAKLWAGRCPEAPAATITLPGSPAVCCVDFCPWDEQLLALAAADHCVHLYDLRRLAAPLATLASHHRRAVSYAKFFLPGQLVSASIDGTLAAWKLPAGLAGAAAGTSSHSSSTTGWPGPSAQLQAQQQQQQQQRAGLASSSSSLQPWKVFKGHRNERNFVGLALQPSAGLMAVGSESSEVCAYHTSWSSPLARFCMAEQMSQPATLTWQQQQQQRSVCAVAWQPVPAGSSCCSGGGTAAALLAAASSAGDCKLLMLQEP